MSSEVKKLTTMLFGLVDHPRSYVRAHDFSADWAQFLIEFGELESDGCRWDVWTDGWSRDGVTFRTRCLVYENERTKTIVTAYGDDLHDPRVRFQTMPLRYKHLGVSGITEAHKHLDVFANGMFASFPIKHRVQPFLDAAR